MYLMNLLNEYLTKCSDLQFQKTYEQYGFETLSEQSLALIFLELDPKSKKALIPWSKNNLNMNNIWTKEFIFVHKDEKLYIKHPLSWVHIYIYIKRRKNVSNGYILV